MNMYDKQNCNEIIYSGGGSGWMGLGQDFPQFAFLNLVDSTHSTKRKKVMAMYMEMCDV